MKHEKGFTLIEIMVVVVLISIAATLIGFNIGRDKDQIASLEARRFAALLEHAREDSLLTGKVFGVEVHLQDSAYRFFELADKWQEIERDDVYRQRTVPPDIRFQVKIDKKEKKIKGKRYIVINPTGDMTDFKVFFKGEKQTYAVETDESQNITVSNVDERGRKKEDKS